MHNKTMLYLPKFSLDGRILDKSKESYQQELKVINAMPEFEISIGHYRYVKDLVSIGKKVIYITFDQNDKQTIYSRLDKKVSILNVTEYHYNTIRGVDWPSYDEFKNGNIPPEMLDAKDWLSDWFYALPETKSNICEIKFKEIISGDALYSKLSNFLNCSGSQQQVNDLINEYRKSQ